MMRSLRGRAVSLATAIAVYAVLRVLGIIGAPEAWSTYESDDGGYTVLAPGSMRHTTDTVSTTLGPVIFEDAAIEFVDVRYAVGHAEIPLQVTDGMTPERLVSLMVPEFRREGYTMGRRDPAPWRGHPSVYVELDDAQETHRVLHRAALVGQRLYRLIVIVPVDSLDSEREYYEKFLNSFALASGG